MSRFTGFYRAVVVVGFLLAGGIASAEVAPRRLPGAQTRTAPKPAPKKLAAPKKLVGSLAKAEPATPPAPTANAVMMSYQRIGRDIKLLQNLRGTECTLELWTMFREIKLEEATATAVARIETADLLLDLQQKIERKRGVTMRQECLDNPLAPECG